MNIEGSNPFRGDISNGCVKIISESHILISSRGNRMMKEKEAASLFLNLFILRESSCLLDPLCLIEYIVAVYVLPINESNPTQQELSAFLDNVLSLLRLLKSCLMIPLSLF